MMIMQARMQERMQLEMQRRMRLEAQIWQGMTEEQRDRIREQQRMRMMVMAAQQAQMRAEHIRVTGSGAEGPMPPVGMPFPRGPLFFTGQMGAPAADPRNRSPTGAPDGRPTSPAPSHSDSSEGSARGPRAGVRNGQSGIVYGDWEVEDLSHGN
jgi:hypothetical protein